MDGTTLSPGTVAPRRARRNGPGAPQVAGIVENEVIPRLLLSRRLAGAPRRPSVAHVETLARLALSRDPNAASAQVFALRETGAPVEALLNELITPAARRLGDFWLADSVDFIEVALATARLSTVVRALGAAIPDIAGPGAPTALVATLDPERHALGAMVLALTLRLAGWRVVETPGMTVAALEDWVRAAPPDLACLSLGGDRSAPLAAEAVRRVRAAGGAGVAVALGGAACIGDPDLAGAAGADFGAGDAPSAVARAHAHLSKTLKTVQKA